MLFKRIFIISTVLTVILMLAATYHYRSAKISLSLLGGDGIGLANFYLLARVVTGLLARESTGKGRLMALFFLKLLLLVALFGIILTLPIDIIAFVAGLSAVVVATLVVGLWTHTSTGSHSS